MFHTLSLVLIWFMFISAGMAQESGSAGSGMDIAFVRIPGGSFQMGDIENVGFSGEKPVHTVTLSGFDMSECEIANAHYAQFLNEALTAGDISATDSNVKGANGAYTGLVYLYLGGGHDENNQCWIHFDAGAFTVEPGKENWPVVYVTWYGAKAFVLHYKLDLPTESEWEYACRGGQQYKFGTDDGTISKNNANYDSNLRNPADVGSYPPNPYGLHDLSGNVWEWCNDWLGSYPSQDVKNSTGPDTGMFRIVRGGGWRSYITQCRAANRFHYMPDFGYYDLGFRVVRRGAQ